jgi:WD40 repeat protein
VAYGAAGTLLATHPTRTTTTLWRVTDPGQPARLGTLPSGGGGVFFPDGRTYVAYAEDTTTLWDVRDPARPVRLAAVAGGGEGPLSPDGAVLATATTAGTVLWNVSDPAHPRRIGVLDGTTDPANPADPVFDARPVFSPDSRTAAVGHGDGGVTLFDTATGALVAALPPTPDSPNNDVQIGASDTLTTVAFDPNGHTLSVITGNATVSVWTLDDRQAPVRTQILTRHTAGAGRVAFSPDATAIAGAATDGGNTITLWRLLPAP